jgi:hypothetical protein
MMTNDPSSLGKRILHGAGIWALCALACMIAALLLNRTFALNLRPSTMVVLATLLTVAIVLLRQRGGRLR